MAGVSPAAASNLAQQTPSPFSFSVASTRWSSRPSIHLSNVFLRFLALVFSFVSALSLAAVSPNKETQFTDYPEFIYCFIVSILSFIYSVFQLFKGICDIAHRGILMSDMISDYTSFILDQLVGYVLISSSSMAIPVIRHAQLTGSLWRAAITSTTISFVTSLIFATCTLLSGYKLCKRIIW
ncbi:hypothetical protein Ddye_003211 [Dipteronia dyeriana]|uniref:CASP-like protein n=1 Tax=Dipteronia dyeriana TaxID=168575 RepID=A0AAD9XT20_9ROSI|nr:hypothetical protein Ddye_003211 [Dipteronia dyeriana]